MIGAVGYAVESEFTLFLLWILLAHILVLVTDLVSSKYTPFSPSIDQLRAERLSSDDALKHATDKKKQAYENVLEQNLSASLSAKRE